MPNKSISRIQTAIKFVIVWLIVLYLFEIVKDGRQWVGGIGAVVVAVFVNLYARKKAAACVETTSAFYFWLYIPVVLLFALPIAFKVILVATSDDSLGWWDHFVSLLPFILKLGVPAGALIWTYVALGRLADKVN